MSGSMIGLFSSSLHNGVPQSPQNRLRMVRPLSATLSKGKAHPPKFGDWGALEFA